MVTLRARVLTPESPSRTRFLSDAFVVVGDDGTITAIGPYDGRAVDEDLRPAVLTPGFVDAHLHFPQTRVVGSASGPLLTWLERSVFPEEARFADRTHAEAVADVFCTTLAAAGTTLSMVYGSVHPEASDALFGALDRTGLKAIAGPVLMDRNCPEALQLPVGKAIPALEDLAERWHGHDTRLELAVIPRFALSCSAEMLARAGELSRRAGLWATTHLSETLAECAIACEQFSAPDYLSVYEEAGLLHERSVYAHCIHLSDSEWRRFAAAGAVIAHCADSNFFLGSGNMPLGPALEHAIPLAVGTDVAAGRSFRVPRTLSHTYDNALIVGRRDITPAHLLYWGTRGGALALGHEETGLLREGLDADMVLHDVPEWAESEQEVLGWLLFHTDAPWPLRTWVRGSTIWRRPASPAYPWAT